MDNLRNEDDINLSWLKKPEIWADQHDQANRIIIGVENRDGTPKYTLTFYVTTGTICVQGTQYRLFTDEHFPILREILRLVLEH
jgi:hypothetical protein